MVNDFQTLKVNKNSTFLYIHVKKRWFINSRQGHPSGYYEYDDKNILGTGAFGKVVKAIDRESK